MFLIPLSQIESVELVIHALKIAAGEADCTTCPVRRACMKQCSKIAESLSTMVFSGSLPVFGAEQEPEEPAVGSPKEEKGGKEKGHLKVIK